VNGKEGQGSGSFLKKRTKKLLCLAWRDAFVPIKQGVGRYPQRSKSFLVLFFKKGLLSSSRAMAGHPMKKPPPQWPT
jgi:hypothetical protein